MVQVIKKERNIKGYIYARLPLSEASKRKIKDLYYDKVIWPKQKLENKKDYGMEDMFGAVGIETTTYCNLRCSFCPNSKYERGLKKNEKLMDLELFDKILNDLSKIKFKGIIRPFFYGDPLTDKRMPELVARIKNKLPKAKIYLNTNGISLTVLLYQKLEKAGMDYLMVSQYTKNMLPNIKEVFKYLKTRPEKENKIKYRVFGEDVIELSNRGGEIEIEKLSKRPFCAYPGHYDLNIDYQGNILLCCNDYLSSVQFGNIRNENLMDIWKKPNYYKIRNEAKTGTYNLEICKKCVGMA